MASIDRFYFGDNPEGLYDDFLNVDEVVGPNGINLPGDVMVVQALLLFLGETLRGFPKKECAPVTGSFDTVTRDAIRKYQKMHNKTRIKALGRLVTDGRVSPAREQRITFGGGRFTWTIITLNFWARISARKSHGDNELGYVEEILEQWPVLRNNVKLPIDFPLTA